MFLTVLFLAGQAATHLVIYLPLLRIPQYVIRLVDLFELVGVAAWDVHTGYASVNSSSNSMTPRFSQYATNTY